MYHTSQNKPNPHVTPHATRNSTSKLSSETWSIAKLTRVEPSQLPAAARMASWPAAALSLQTQQRSPAFSSNSPAKSKLATVDLHHRYGAALLSLASALPASHTATQTSNISRPCIHAEDNIDPTLTGLANHVQPTRFRISNQLWSHFFAKRFKGKNLLQTQPTHYSTNQVELQSFRSGFLRRTGIS